MYYPDEKNFAIYKAKLTDTLSCASEFEFNMPVQNQLYDALEERVSMIQILRDNEEVFYGEVREVSENIDKVKSVYCVGELAFLFDSIQPQARYQGITPEQLFIEMLNIHNSKVEEKKRFKVGIVTVKDPNNSLYRFTNGEDTLTAIREKLCAPLGGYLRIRKVDGERYLDLVPLEEYGVSASQPIQFGRNLLKYNSKKSGSSIATVCVPRGAKLDAQVVEGLDAYVDIKSVNDGKEYVVNEEALKHYGWIEKVVSWDDVTVPQNLKNKAQEWIDCNQYNTLSLELKAVDLAELSADMEPYKVGDMVHAIAEPFGMDMWFPLAKKVTYINDAITNDVSLSYEMKVSYTQQQNNKYQQIENEIPQETRILNLAKMNASELIKNATEGNVYYVYDEAGRMKEQLIMDTNDINTAKKVWRWNINGLGYSKNGYEGPYALAMTMDGAFVADLITVGILNANIIRAGILQDLAGNNYWNLETGEFSLKAVNDLKKEVIKSVDVMYALGDSTETAPEDGWTTSAPAWTEGMYMWQKTVTTYSDDTQEETSATCISGATGQPGANGQDGANGKDGADGKDGINGTNGKDGENGKDGSDGIGISALAEEYYLSSSNTAQTGDSWSTAQPEWKDGYYIWTRSKITWTNNATTYTEPVLAAAINGANQGVHDLDKNLTQEEIFNRLTNNGAIDGIFMKDGQLYVNASYLSGGKITTSIFEVEGTVTKNASDYSADDRDRANRISIGAIEPTIEDLEKLDLNGDGLISITDAIKIGQMIEGTLDQVVIPTKVVIDALSTQSVFKTDGVSIGINGAYLKNLTSQLANIKELKILVDGQGYKSGYDGTFSISDGRTVTVTSGIITSIA